MLATVIISAGINMLIMGIGNIFGVNNNELYIVSGLLLITVSLIIIFVKDMKKSNRKYLINAIVTYNKETQKIIPFNNYEFLNDLHRYMDAAIKEEPNIKAMWEKDTLGISHIFNKKGENSFVEVSRSGATLNQLIEYLVLKQLELETSEYFNNPIFDKGQIHTLCRSDISEFVANNVFLNLFTKPTYERIAFDNKEIEKNVVFCYGRNGAVYDRFELNLPPKCFLTKKGNRIVINHPIFRLKITPAFTGFGHNLPIAFERKYMKCEPRDTTCYKVCIGVELKFNWKAFFVRKTLYYGWIDSYIDRLKQYASIDEFFQRVPWELVNAVISSIK